MEKTIKELCFEADTLAHQKNVGKCMMDVAYNIMLRAMKHDESKMSEDEKPYYVNPVYRLNTGEVEYGSDEYKTLTAEMGKGWEHHATHNDHHPEFFNADDPLSAMNFIQLIEMLCDWKAASMRRGNDPLLPLDRFDIDRRLKSIFKNTLEFLVDAGIPKK